MADDHLIEQGAERRQVQFLGRDAARMLGEVSANGGRFDVGQRDVLWLQPKEESPDGQAVDGAGVRIAYLGGEEFVPGEACVLAA